MAAPIRYKNLNLGHSVLSQKRKASTAEPAAEKPQDNKQPRPDSLSPASSRTMSPFSVFPASQVASSEAEEITAAWPDLHSNIEQVPTSSPHQSLFLAGEERESVSSVLYHRFQATVLTGDEEEQNELEKEEMAAVVLQANPEYYPTFTVCSPLPTTEHNQGRAARGLPAAQTALMAEEEIAVAVATSEADTEYSPTSPVYESPMPAGNVQVEDCLTAPDDGLSATESTPTIEAQYAAWWTSPEADSEYPPTSPVYGSPWELYSAEPTSLTRDEELAAEWAALEADPDYCPTSPAYAPSATAGDSDHDSIAMSPEHSASSPIYVPDSPSDRYPSPMSLPTTSPAALRIADQRIRDLEANLKRSELDLKHEVADKDTTIASLRAENDRLEGEMDAMVVAHDMEELRLRRQVEQQGMAMWSQAMRTDWLAESMERIELMVQELP